MLYALQNVKKIGTSSSFADKRPYCILCLIVSLKSTCIQVYNVRLSLADLVSDN